MSQESQPTRTVYRTCPLCEATCGIAVQIEGDRVVRVRGDEDDPFSRGFICPKGSTLAELHHDPDRLREPLVRRNGRLEKATWDEAFEAIQAGLLPILEKHGRTSLAVVVGNPTTHHLAANLYIRPLIMAAGTPNLYSASTADQMPAHVAAGYLWGEPGAFPIPDIDRTDYLLMLGANPVASNGSTVTAPDFPGRLKAIQARGGRFVVVDPRKTETAARADEHFFIRPGTDVYWLAALARVLFEEDLVAIGRLESAVTGVEELRTLVASFTPEAVAPVCGIDADSTRRVARELANADAAAVYGRLGTHTVEFGTATAWLISALNVLTGNFDRPGGVMTASPVTSPIFFDRKPGGPGFKTGRWKSRVRQHSEVTGELPVVGLAEEIETPGEGQIRAVLTVAANPVRSYPNSDRLDRAFETLEFHVAVDIYLNETTRHADVILPGPSPFEGEQYDLLLYANAVRSVAKFSPAAFERVGLAEEDIFARLMGLLQGMGAQVDPKHIHDMLLGSMVDQLVAKPKSAIAGRDRAEILAALNDSSPVEKLLDLQLRTGWKGDAFGALPDGLSLAKLAAHPHGMDFGPMVERFPARFKTKSGMLELAPEPLVEDWARVVGGFERARDAKQMLLIGRRHVRSNNSWSHNIPSLVKGRPRCTLLVHPDDAARLGLVDASLCNVKSRTGELRVAAEISDSMMPGVVSLPHGWGHGVPGTQMEVAAAHPGVASNVLTDDSVFDVPSGNAILNGIAVEISASTED
ncbi:MAG: anaerobic selenocysteine-containing dehydrogenase [Myxococcota bacterium]|jgi:anaerobic selenocysteine-containing dehydrogenase